MNLKSIGWGAAGLGLLALAGALVPLPRPNARPALPEIVPFQAGERVALFLPDFGSFPAPDGLGLVQRARAAGAEVRAFAPGDSMEEFNPTRIYTPWPWPDSPTGYHPDQWPTPPSGDGWQMLVLTPEEQAVRNAAVLAAAKALRESSTDDLPGTRESALLARARRAELYRPFRP